MENYEVESLDRLQKERSFEVLDNNSNQFDLPAYARRSGAGDEHHLKYLGELYDATTIAMLNTLDFNKNWHCLEVGAGAGTIANWLNGQLGAGGRVTATDIDTQFIESLQSSNIDVLQHDLTKDALPISQYDLVHCRLVLEHLNDPVAALNKLVHALKPGGWLLVEDFDWDYGFPVSDNGSDTYKKIHHAMRTLWESQGYSPSFGKHLPTLLIENQFEQVRAQGSSQFLIGGTPLTNAYVHDTLSQFAPVFVSQGLLTKEELLKGLAWSRHDRCIGMQSMLVSTLGQKPNQRVE
jgi:SAM-dependent methyltransferase